MHPLPLSSNPPLDQPRVPHRPGLRLALLCLGGILCNASAEAEAPPRSRPPNLVFACRADNDLYAAVARGGRRYPRHADAATALRRAPPGAGVLILADGYPGAVTPIGPDDFALAADKHLRLYVEYPAWLPDLSPGTPRSLKTGEWGNTLERAVVTSDAFGPALPKLRILTVQDCRYLPVAAPSHHLAAAWVAGYDRAVFGLPDKEVWPLLFEHPRGDALVATTKLSQFVTGRYAPSDAWGPVWAMVFRWLQPGAQPPAIRWEPTVRPAYGPQERLPRNFELQAIRRGTEWFFKSGLLVHPSWQAQYDRPANMGPPTPAWPWGHRCGPAPDRAWPSGDGSLGMLEGFRSRIAADGSQAALWWRRHDCNGEVAGALAMAGALLRNEEYRRTAGRMGDWLYGQSIMTQGDRANPQSPSFGLCGWNDVPRYYGDLHGYEVYYADDNARGVLGMLKAAAALQAGRWDERAMQALLGNLRLSSQLGFLPDRTDQPTLNRTGWQTNFAGRLTMLSPHHQAYIEACFLWAYRQTGFALFRDRAAAAIRVTYETYPDRWPWVNGQVTLELARFLLPLAWLVRVDDTPEHRAWLKRIATELLAEQDACGAIRTKIRSPAGSNRAFGTEETSLIHQNGDPLSDLLYESNFALVGLHEAFAATGDPVYRQAEDRLAEYICRIQARSTRHPELDGVWYRGFDFRRWDYWGADADIGWGLWSSETGWTQGEILATLVLRQTNTSLWDYLGNSRIARHFERNRREMIPDAVLATAHPAGVAP